jgi:chromosome segregation ATPase
MSDWGGDYSMILHNVEDKLDHHLDENSASTRKRIRADSMSLIDQDGDSFNQSITSSSVLRLNLQLDEAKIKNEELVEKINSQRDDFARQKEKYIRQLEFMENDNIELKAELESKKEKYFAIKKKLQSTIRAADSEKQVLTQQILQLSQSKSISTTSAAPSDMSSIWEDRLNKLEASISVKNTEAKTLSIKNAELEEKCAVLQHKLLAARSDISDGDSQSTARSLQKQVSDLESLLRRRSREVEKLENQLKNQHLLEQDLSSCNQKLLNLRTAAKTLHDVEAKYNVLLKEKESWTLYFQDIVMQLENSRGDTGGGGAEATGVAREVTPVLVLRLLSNVQSKCASLLRAQCELDSKNSTLRSQLRQSEIALKDAEETRLAAVESSERVNQSSALLKQQVQLYEGEVMSLRALLKTFDAEVAILEGQNRSSRRKEKSEAALLISGGDATEALCRAKDAVIQELRAEVDTLRLQRQSDLQQIAEAREAAHRAEATLSRLREGGGDGAEGGRGESVALQSEKKALKQKCEDLLVELLALQKAAGFDFIPGKTKVRAIKSKFLWYNLVVSYLLLLI